MFLHYMTHLLLDVLFYIVEFHSNTSGFQCIAVRSLLYKLYGHWDVQLATALLPYSERLGTSHQELCHYESLNAPGPFLVPYPFDQAHVTFAIDSSLRDWFDSTIPMHCVEG